MTENDSTHFEREAIPALVNDEALIGKTVSNVTYGEVDGAFGPEPLVILHFTDGSQHGFVLPVQVG